MNQHNPSTYDTIRICLIDATSFEIEETLDFKLALTSKSTRVFLERSNLFFDPDGEMMYVERDGRIYEWKLRARQEGLEWWLGEW